VRLGANDGARDAEGSELAVQGVAGRTRLVAGADRARVGPVADERPDGLGRVGDPVLVDAGAVGAQEGDVDAELADVEADIDLGTRLEHGRRPPYVATPAFRRG